MELLVLRFITEECKGQCFSYFLWKDVFVWI